MSNDHDPESGFLAGASGTALANPDPAAVAMAPVPDVAGGDALADVLQGIRLSGALFFLVKATTPWCVEIPEAPEYAGIILPRARHVVSYHVIVEGQGLASVPGTEPVTFGSGDIIVFPHADAYAMRSAPGVPPELDPAQTIGFFEALAAGQLPFTVEEGGGNDPVTRVICGFLGCDAGPFNPLLDNLPRLLHIRRDGNEDGLLENLIGLTLAEARNRRVGGESIRLRLSELMFVEVLRRHLESLAVEETGWFSGLKDRAVGRALSLLHGRPAEPWTLEALAREAGLSRTVLAERFTKLVGQPPIQYLARWRVQLAARALSDGNAKVAAVGAQVGYASEAAFSRAFKKIAGMSPAAWRRQLRAD